MTDNNSDLQANASGFTRCLLFQDVSRREASQHQLGVPDHRCQGDVLVVRSPAAEAGRATLYPFTRLVKKGGGALHPSP